MPARITVTLDYEYPELFRHGFGLTRTANAIAPATFVDNASDELKKFNRIGLPEDFWREPHHGTILLRPSALKEDFWTNAVHEEYRLGESDFRIVADTMEWDTTTKAGYLMRADPTTELVSLGSLIDRLADLLTDILSDMACTMETVNPFAPNEGIALYLRPYGIFTDGAKEWLGVMFGHRYFLLFTTRGTAKLYSFNPGGTPEWRELMKMSYSQGGVDHTKPFQVTIIPWGRHFISFIFSQARLETGHLISMGQGSTNHQSAFICNLDDLGEPFYWDSTLNHWVKTNMDLVRVSFAKTKYAAGLQISRVRYDTDVQSLYVYPERLEVAHPNADVDAMLEPIGYQPGVKDGAGNGRSLIVATPLNQMNVDFVPADDTQIVAKLDFTASTDSTDPNKDGLYSPELHSLDYDIDEDTHVPDRDPINLSEYWNFIEIRRGVDPAPQSGLIRYERQDRLDTMFRFGGPVRIVDDTTPIFEGYAVRKPTTLDGPKAIVQQQLDCRDMWVRLDEHPLYEVPNIDGKPLLEMIEKFIKRAGFTSSEINIVDPDGYLDKLKLPTNSEPNDHLTFSAETTCGDAIRAIIDMHSFRPIRIRPVNGQFKIYLAPVYNPASPPTKKFYLRSSLMANQGDAARWAANEFKVLTNPEWSVEEPDFNTIRAKISTSSEAPAVGHMISISNETSVDSEEYAMVNDKTHVSHMGRVKPLLLGPQDLPSARTKQDAIIQCRTYYERHHKGLRNLEFGGEWNSTIDADDFIWVIGLDENLARVSYGAYRIENLVAEIDKDFPNKDSRWDWHANYCCLYVGTATDGSTPMWTDAANLP